MQTKKVKITLERLDGNGMALIGAWRRAARQQEFDDEAIHSVTEDAMSGDYDHLVSVLMEHSEDEDA